MEFKQLQEVNKKLQTIDIKGKDYVEVNKRIMAFRELYPHGSINNEIVSNNDGVIIMQCVVSNTDIYISNDGEVSSATTILAVAHAYEKEGNGFINKTSYIENCETSAVGRALGMLGIGVDTSVASYEEVANAIHQQKKTEKPTSADLEVLANLMAQADSKSEDVLKAYHVEKFKDMSLDQYYDCCRKLQKKIDGKKNG